MKAELIEEIRKQLKSEFVGIDYVIDHVIDSIKNWISTDKMRTPNIICLWGLTGSGKTQLVRRIIQLFELTENYYYFHMGNIDTLTSIFDTLEDNAKLDPKSIFVFDEFQMCNTKDPKKEEDVERPMLRDLWGILDNGRVIKKLQPLDKYSIRSLIDEVYYINKHSLLNWTVERIEKSKKHSEEIYQLIGISDFIKVQKFLDVNLSPRSYHLRSEFNKYKMSELIDMYEKALNANIQKEYDFSKSLIFILGNLDILYKDAKDVDSDIDPDLLYERYNDIKFQDGKKALSQLFRPEQISRFGNNHLFYNAFSRENYHDLIKMYLEKVNEYYDVKLVYDQTVIDMIYVEGVFPSQGVRPIISTIKYTIEANLNEIQAVAKRKKNISYEDGHLIVNGKHKIKLFLVNTVLDVKRDYFFKRVCVHEAGHAWACYRFFNKAPDNIVIKTNTKDGGGFVEHKEDDRTFTAEHIKKHVCVMLAGLVSETMVFGNHSAGASDDLKQATSLVQKMTTIYGMGNQLVVTKYPEVEANLNVYQNMQEIESYLKSRREEVERVFEEDKDNFKKLVSALYEKVKMTKQDFYKLFPPIETVQKEDKCFHDFFGIE